MNKEDILGKLPSDGFLKTAKEGPSTISGEQRVALIRKGNELYNKGDFDLARKIFVTARYSDGLIRIGDTYVKDGKHLEALRMYWLAPAPEKTAAIAEQMAQVMRKWLSEEKTEKR